MTELEKFEQYVQEYTDKNHIDAVKYNSEITKILNYSEEELEKLTDQQCLHKSYILTSYCLFLQSDYNATTAKLDWCNDTIFRIMAESYNDFDKYMKHEVRRAASITNNDFAKQVEEVRKHIQARHTLLSNKVDDVRNLVKILEQLARKKGYVNNTR